MLKEKILYQSDYGLGNNVEMRPLLAKIHRTISSSIQNKPVSVRTLSPVYISSKRFALSISLLFPFLYLKFVHSLFLSLSFLHLSFHLTPVFSLRSQYTCLLSSAKKCAGVSPGITKMVIVETVLYTPATALNMYQHSPVRNHSSTSNQCCLEYHRICHKRQNFLSPVATSS